MKITDDAGRLELYFFGPGVGESIAIRLPSGDWGVVDCYAKSPNAEENVLVFLKKRGVQKLAFFCLTHPHADHFSGAHWLLKEYRGKIDRIWRHPGFSTRDITMRMLLAGKVKARRFQDTEAEELVDEYATLLHEIDQAKHALISDGYRRVVAPVTLLEGGNFIIRALRPTSFILDEIESHIVRQDASDGFLLLDESEGELLNSLSVVLAIEFGKIAVYLLADAQGAGDRLHHTRDDFTAIKVAHHGSANGFAAETLVSKGVKFGVITPYLRSQLPRLRMIERYNEACESLVITGKRPLPRPKKIVPGLKNARLTKSDDSWAAISLDEDGDLQEISL